MMTKIAVLTMAMCLVVLSLSLTACETIEGAGRDLEAAGESVQDAAQ